MPKFLNLGKELGVSRIDFQQIHNQLLSMNADEFIAADVFNPQLKEHNNLLEILSFLRKARDGVKINVVLPALG